MRVTYFFISLIIFQHCYASIINKDNAALLDVISSFNGEGTHPNIILYGSAAWFYNIEKARKSGSVLFKEGIRDLDFFVMGEKFKEIIGELKNKNTGLEFSEIMKVPETGLTYCRAFISNNKSKPTFVADFTSLSTKVDHDVDVFKVENQGLTLHVFNSDWLIKYEIDWLNSLGELIKKFSNEKRCNKGWWVCFENKSKINSIKKSFLKYQEHVQLLYLLTGEIKYGQHELSHSLYQSLLDAPADFELDEFYYLCNRSYAKALREAPGKFIPVNKSEPPSGTKSSGIVRTAASLTKKKPMHVEKR